MSLAPIHVPVAIILLGGGLLSCFLGYRLLRVLLTGYGFVAGILLATLFVGQVDSWQVSLFVVASGLIGATLALSLYLAVVGLFGAGVSAYVVNLIVNGDPNVWFLFAICILGALLSLLFRRFVLIFGTSFVGAWTAVVGGSALAGDSGSVAVLMRDPSQVFPAVPLSEHVGFAIAWTVLGILGFVLQFMSAARIGRSNGT